MEGARLRAKGEEIEFDTETGKKKFLLRPIKNKQLLEVVELADKEKGIKAALLLAKYSLNRDPKIENGTEKPFTDEEMEETEAPFLIQIMEKAAKINGMGDLFDFQMRGKEGLPQEVSEKSPFKRNLDLLNKHPAKKLS